MALKKAKDPASWQARVQAYCYELWGRGGFESLRPKTWARWWKSDARKQLSEWEFANWVVLPWCAHHAMTDPENRRKALSFADLKDIKKRQAAAVKTGEWYKKIFIDPAAYIARRDANPPAKEEIPDEEIDVGNLEQPPRDPGNLRRVYAKVNLPDYELTKITPQAVLIWVEQMTDAFADRGEFPTLQCLANFIHHMPTLDWDDAVVACRTMSALFHTEEQQEKESLRRMVERAMRPDPVPEKRKEKPSPDAPKVRPGSKWETRTGAAGAVTVTEGKKGGKKYRIWGHPVTAVIRWMGSDAWTFDDVRLALKELGVPDVGDNTVKAQLIAGRKGGDCDGRGPAAELTGDQQNILNTMLEGRTDGEGEEPAPGRRPGREDEPEAEGRAPRGRVPGKHPESPEVHRNGKRDVSANGKAPEVRAADEPARLRRRAGGPGPGKKDRQGGVGKKPGQRDRDRGKPVVGKGRSADDNRQGRKKARGKLKRR
jgi:hypothetical protein